MNFSSGAGGSAAGARPAKRPPSRPVNLHLGRRGNKSAVAGSRGTRPGGGMPGKAFTRSGGARPARSGQRGGGMPAKAFSRSANPFSRSRAFRRSSALGDGRGGQALRPSSRGPRLRGGVMQGGSASGARAVSVRFNARPARPVQLRLGSGRRRDGAIGGSVLGRRGRGRGPGRGKVHTPRFRGTRGSALGGRRPPASALKGRRFFGRHVFGPRRSPWRIFGQIFGKRSGGL